MSSTTAPSPEQPWTAVGPREAPGIVFVHGTRLTRAQWRPQVRRLARRYRCVAVDLPGHGALSQEPFSLEAASRTVIAAIDAEVPSGRAVLVGLSLGGYVAIEVAERHAGHVTGLVLAGCSAEPMGPLSALVRPLAWLLERVPADSLDVLNRAYFRLRYRPSIAGPIIEGGFWSAAGAAALRELARVRFLVRLSRLWTPVLIVNGALDPVFGPGGDSWATACRRGRHAVIERAMHLSNLDRPAAFAAAVASFVDDVAETERAWDLAPS
jgi:pimeloyl-ACP methyl ester carboxylesterase